MAREEIKRDFSVEEVTKIVVGLGSGEPRHGANGELIFQTVCHHGDSYKLYYYPNSKSFHCFTHCGDSFDLYELVRRSMDCDFSAAMNHISRSLGVVTSHKSGFTSDKIKFTEDWEILRRYGKNKTAEHLQPIFYPKTLLDYYASVFPVEWLREGISPETMEKFCIRFDVAHNKIIIPQFDAEGNLVGIRGRALNEEDVDQGKKYMPCIIENTVYRHPTGYNLYGLYQNQEAIRRAKKVILFEAEKSVLKCDSFYGKDNISLAVYGSSVSAKQRDMILNLGVKEVFLAFDKEYHEAFSDESDVYAEKLLNIAYKFCPYVSVWVLWDTEGLLGYKDSPADKGKDILEHLLKNKFEVLSREEE